ncbi:hypothetical protein QTH90_21670 [Variovorax sp. J2P1-59]|uniref:hypothetical protein n=1 Tax=Variovorax flavidus TaxID=3053501 RepID=UPI002574B15F|nr:hypothetical protein [Variovorax sp. J2P1-59]MDM0077034.1 hypothetical protein [Variovorax sp. J2P1-59]
MNKKDDVQEHRPDDLAVGALETIAFHFPLVAMVVVFAAIAVWSAFSFIRENWAAVALVIAVPGLGLLAWRYRSAHIKESVRKPPGR